MARLTVVLLFCFLLSSCKGPQHKELAEARVAQFRSDFRAEKYHSIYVSADDEFRQATSEADFISAMQLVHRKLGNVRQTHLRYYVDGRMTNETGAILTSCMTLISTVAKVQNSLSGE